MGWSTGGGKKKGESGNKTIFLCSQLCLGSKRVEMAVGVQAYRAKTIL